jgi:hypothetical protein
VIYADLGALVMKHDSKLLAIVMLTYGAQLLRGIHSAGFMSAEEALATAREAIREVGDPLPKNEVPQVVTLEGTPVSGRRN